MASSRSWKFKSYGVEINKAASWEPCAWFLTAREKSLDLGLVA